MTATPTVDTRERLLDAAERHFAERGFDGASMREITADARANLAAAHYHFGSKEDLFLAVVTRRMAPINAERLARLDAAEARAGDAPLAVEEILDIAIGPPLRVAHSGGVAGACFLRLVGRVQSESEALWQRIMDGPLREVRPRIQAALQRALPHLPPAELAWRMHFVFSAMSGVAGDQHRLRVMSKGMCDPGDIEGTLRRLLPFLAAGMHAPLPPSPTPRAAKKRTRSRHP